MRLPGLLLLAALLPGCGDGKPQSYKAQASVEGFVISVEMVSAHPLLAEYDKHVEIRKDSRQVSSFVLADPGAFATIYVVADEARLLVVDGLLNGVTIDKASTAVTAIEPADVPENLAEQSLGQFKFVDAPERYKWVPTSAKAAR